MVTLKYLLGEKGSAIKCFARAFRTGLIFNAKLRLMPCFNHHRNPQKKCRISITRVIGQYFNISGFLDGVIGIKSTTLFQKYLINDGHIDAVQVGNFSS